MIYARLSTGFGILVFFANLSLLKFPVRYLNLFCLFLVRDRLEWLWIGSLHKNIQLMVEFLKASFKAQGPTLFLLYINDLPDHVIYNITIYADKTTLYSKYDPASGLWQQLDLVSELESDLLDTVHIGVNIDGFVLEEKSSFKIFGFYFATKLDFGSYITSIVKTAFEKIGVMIRSMKFFSPEVALYLYKSTIRPCMEYCCHVWAGAPSCYLEMLDKLQKWKFRSFICAASLETLSHRRNVASLSLSYRYYFGTCSSELAQLFPLSYSCGRSTRYSERLHDFSIIMSRSVLGFLCQ